MKKQMNFRNILATTGLLVLSLMLTRCGSNNSNSTTSNAAITPSFASIYTNVLSQACIQCHVPGTSVYINNNVHLDFTSASTAYSSLTGLTSSGVSSSSCNGIKYVTPGSPSSSYLAAVLFADYNTSGFAGDSGCTPYATHLSDQNISSAEETAIIAWINAGAANN